MRRRSAAAVGLPLPEVIDVQLLFRRAIVCAGGDHRHSIRLDPRELVRLAEPRVGYVSTAENALPQRFAAAGRDRSRRALFA